MEPGLDQSLEDGSCSLYSVSPHIHSVPGPPRWPPGSPVPACHCGAHSTSGTCCPGLAGHHPCTTWNQPESPVSQCSDRAISMVPSGCSAHPQTKLPELRTPAKLPQIQYPLQVPFLEATVEPRFPSHRRPYVQQDSQTHDTHFAVISGHTQRTPRPRSGDHAARLSHHWLELQPGPHLI